MRTVTPGGGMSFMLVSIAPSIFIVTVPLLGSASSGLISILSSGATPAVALPVASSISRSRISPYVAFAVDATTITVAKVTITNADLFITIERVSIYILLFMDRVQVISEINNLC